MKRYIGILFLIAFTLSITGNVNAQKGLLRHANKLYEYKAYAEAIPKYEQALKMDSTLADAIFNLADCYRLVNNSKKAEKYFGKAVMIAGAKPINKYYYAQALMQNGKYQQAEKYMNEFSADDRGKTFTEAIKNLDAFYKDTALYTIKFAPFNSSENDFSPVIQDKDIVFVSARKRVTIFKYTHRWTNEEYYFLYKTHIGKKAKYIRPKLFARNIQIRYNDGPICFESGSKTIYFTRNNLRKNKAVKAENGDVKLNLYVAQFNAVKKRFDNIEGFHFNSDQYNTAHPSVSAAGKRLYFSSDMPGGFGGMDLWVTYNVAGIWSQPKNLGDKINTKGNEIFPCVTEKNNLYFSSNGLEGIGGLDIYSVALNSEGLPDNSPKNMGAHLNSTADDFGIAFYPGEKKGFFSSNRNSYDLNDDIFEFTIKTPEKLPYTILVMDTNTRELLESTIIITDQATGEKTELAEKEGKYIVDLFSGHTYSIDAKSDNYFPKNNTIFKIPADNSEPFEILLNHKPMFFIAGTVYEILDNQSKITVDSTLIQITDANNTLVYSFTTDTSGKYYAPDLLPNTKYKVTAFPKGYFNKSEEVESIPPGGAIRDFYVSKIVIGKAIKIENIYFDFDKSYIRPDAAIELDKIVKLLNENPDIIIELGSHTDCRGSKKYNESLSDRRAKSSAAYIVSKGIDKNRISGKGYGEYQMMIDCPCEGAQVSNCPEEDHQLNRRTEFKVTGFVKGVGNVNMKSDKGTNIHTDPKPGTKK